MDPCIGQHGEAGLVLSHGARQWKRCGIPYDHGQEGRHRLHSQWRQGGCPVCFLHFFDISFPNSEVDLFVFWNFLWHRHLLVAARRRMWIWSCVARVLRGPRESLACLWRRAWRVWVSGRRSGRSVLAHKKLPFVFSRNLFFTQNWFKSFKDCFFYQDYWRLLVLNLICCRKIPLFYYFVSFLWSNFQFLHSFKIILWVCSFSGWMEFSADPSAHPGGLPRTAVEFVGSGRRGFLHRHARPKRWPRQYRCVFFIFQSFYF